MGTEHTPKPGANWGRELVRREMQALDVPVRAEEAQGAADQLATGTGMVGLNEPAPPQPNRAQRRAAARAARRAVAELRTVRVRRSAGRLVTVRQDGDRPVIRVTRPAP
jgi:hypothetical protein